MCHLAVQCVGQGASGVAAGAEIVGQPAFEQERHLVAAQSADHLAADLSRAADCAAAAAAADVFAAAAAAAAADLYSSSRDPAASEIFETEHCDLAAAGGPAAAQAAETAVEIARMIWAEDGGNAKAAPEPLWGAPRASVAAASCPCDDERHLVHPFASCCR